MDILTRINTFFSTHSEQRENLQSILIDVAIHVEQCGNAGFIPFLLQKLTEEGSGLNAPAVCEWINKFTKCEITYDPKHGHQVTYKAHKQTRLNGPKEGKEVKWYSLKKPINFVGFDNVKALHTVVAQTNGWNKKQAKLAQSAKPEDKAKLAEIHLNNEMNKAVQALLNDPRLVQMVNKEFYKLKDSEVIDAEVVENEVNQNNYPAVING